MKRYLLKLTAIVITFIILIGMFLMPITAMTPAFTGYRNLDDLYKHIKGFEDDPFGNEMYKIDEEIFIPFYIIFPKSEFKYSTLRCNWWLFDIVNPNGGFGLGIKIKYSKDFIGKKLHDTSDSKDGYSEDQSVYDDLSKVDLSTIKGLFVATVNGHEIFYYAFDSQITTVEFLINGYYFKIDGIENYSKDHPDYEEVQKLCNLESLGEIIKYYEWATTHRNWGDLNGDFYLNDEDVCLLLRYVANWKVDIDLTAADINGDGEVNDKDACLLVRYYAGNWKNMSLWKLFDKQ